MEYTGERYLPEVEGGIALEHKHRYLLACELARGKEVLDIASGEGYGSFMLAGAALRVTGVDISHEAVAHAGQKYVRENLAFCQGSAAAIPLADASVDMVVSFETIEHHEQHEEMLQEIKRVLRPGGLLLMSSPDRVEYSDVPGYDNEYHVKELTKLEFAELIGRHFARYTLSGQRVAYGSVIGSDNYASDFISWANDTAVPVPEQGLGHAVYILALASDGELPTLASGILEDAQEHSDAYRCQKEDTERARWQLGELEKHLELRLQELQTSADVITECRTVIRSRDKELRRQLATIAEQDKTLAAQRNTLNELYTSRSWRLTEPLRKGGVWVRQCFAEQASPSRPARLVADCLAYPLVLCARMDKTCQYPFSSVQEALAKPDLALKMLRAQKGRFSRYARALFMLARVARKAGTLRAALKIGVRALRSSSAGLYLRGYLGMPEAPAGQAAAKVADNGYIEALVTAHNSGNPRPPVENVYVRVAAQGNHFFREIAQLIACGFEDAGVRAAVVIDEENCACPVNPGCATDLHLVIAPHEYFYFITAANAWPFAQSRLWMLNTEQASTQWFARAASSFDLADLVLDMDFDMSRMLVQQGRQSEHLPLGFSPRCTLFDGVQPVPVSVAAMGLPSRIRNGAVSANPLATPLQERPLDCCFFGASVSRRAEFFARNAALFARMQSYLRLLPMNVPLQAGVNTSLTTEATSSIIRRSKISLNIHQSAHSYFEWHRIVLQGLWQGTLVVSEPCTPALPFKPNIDYVSVDLAHMPEALDYFTASADGRALAERIRAHGHKTLTSHCQIGTRLQELLDIYGVMPGVGR